MGVELQQVLRNLCSNTGWHYAVYWKLRQHHSRMVLTWDNAYFVECGQSHPGKYLHESEGCITNVRYIHDSVKLALTATSFDVHPFGEGIIGEVAASGKHQWVFVDEQESPSFSFIEERNGWKCQFAAGIKTVAVVSASPHGVVLLGSLYKINESSKLIDHIRNSLSYLQLPSVDLVAKTIPNNGESDVDRYQSLLPSSDIHDSSGMNPDIQAILSHPESSDVSLRFSAGCVLHEALRPTFSKQLRNYSKHMKADDSFKTVVFSEAMSSSSDPIVRTSGSEHLLQAVVANIIEDHKSKRTCKSMQSILTTDHKPEVSYVDHMNLLTGPLSSYPSTAKEDMHYSSRTADSYLTNSPTMLSSNCVSSCTEPASKSSETSKRNNKKARPGESLKPRPRDRQLIQDRIKVLRDLIPSGTKCSIDSLLERTIKHMKFMQNMNEHADKLKQCAESKMQSKDAVGSSPGHEQGSSWAVEIDGQFKVCRILVEDVNMNKQMMIEMLCEECSHFLEIAEVIKSLGLTILKSATEACGEETWICFLVEGPKNKSIQRLGILWSLVHVLQPKNLA